MNRYIDLIVNLWDNTPRWSLITLAVLVVFAMMAWTAKHELEDFIAADTDEDGGLGAEGDQKEGRRINQRRPSLLSGG